MTLNDYTSQGITESMVGPLRRWPMAPLEEDAPGPGHRLTAVAHRVLGLGGDLREGGPEGRVVEERVVAEPPLAARPIQKNPFDHAFGRHLPALGGRERDHA